MKSLKKLHPHLKEVASGTVSLLAGDVAQPSTTKPGSVVRRALACYAGSFDGMYGEVVVTREILEGLANRYNTVKANAQNDNDYAPILTDHIREVDRIKGRMLSGLTVEEWLNPETGEIVPGLYCNLRIDDADAQKKVSEGLYAHLSISFDEESFELFEISFVAVEAARGSMVLSKNSQGGKMELSKRLASLKQKHVALAAEVKLARKKRSQNLQAIALKTETTRKEIQSLAARLEVLKQTTKSAQLKARFNGFVKAGKMNPAELGKVDFKSLSLMPQPTLEIVLSAYDNREVSSDVFQYGQAAAPMKTAELTKESMAEAIKLQREGKKGVVLSERQVEGEVVDPAKPKLEGDEDDAMSLSSEEWKATLAEIDDIHGKMGDAVEKLKSLGEDTGKMDDEDKKDEEREMAAEKKGDDLASDDDEVEPKDKK
jgi:hypothetical protein